MRLIPYSRRFVTEGQGQGPLQTFVPADARGQVGTQLELPPVHLRGEAYSPLGRSIFQRVRIAGRVLPGNLPKIHSQDLSSFLYASKRCSSRSDHRLCLLMRERPGSSSLEYPSSSLLRSRSLSLNPPSSSRLDSLLLCEITALASTALPGWGRIRVASLWVGLASAAADAVIPLDGSRDGVCPLKPVKRKECCCSGLIVKSSIFPTWPMLSMSRVSWLKGAPRPSELSRATAVKGQQCGGCGRDVTSVSVGRVSLEDPLILPQSDGNSISMVPDAEGAGDGS
jgi:hypothetical protein